MFVFCVTDRVTTEIYTYLHTLPLHDALPIAPSFSLARLTARRHRPRPSAQPVADHGRAGIGAVGRLRPDELCAEFAPGGSRAAAGQQSDHLATERGAVADQPGAQPREPAALLAPAVPDVGPADAGADDRSAEHRVRRPAGRTGIPYQLPQRLLLGLRLR